MVENRIAMGLLTTGALLAGCSESAPPIDISRPPINISTLESISVACMNVNGFEPYTDARCAEVAANVEAGLKLMSTMTDGKIRPAKVSHKIHPETIDVSKARNKRCTNLNADKPDYDGINDLVFTVAKAAMKEDVDFSKTGLFVSVNAPASICSNKGPIVGPSQEKKPTEQCPAGAAAKVPSYGAARALSELKKPVIFGFGELEKPEREAKKTAHEIVHLFKVGHESVLCSNKDAVMPSVIQENDADLGTDSRSSKASLMGREGQSSYLAVPHQQQMGLLQDRQIETVKSGQVSLVDPSLNGSAIMQLPLKNKAIKKLISAQLVKDDPRPDEYGISLAKIPGHDEIGVYASPLPGKDTGSMPPLFLLDRLRAGEQLTVEGDIQLKVLSATATSASIDLQLY